MALRDRFELRLPLGESDLGVVWDARETATGTSVVVVQLAAGSPDPSRARFTETYEKLAKLSSPHVVRVLETGTDDGAPFAVVEHLSGHHLADRLDEGEEETSIRQIVEWALSILEALDAAHGAGVVHGDVEPGNVFLAEVDGRIVAKLIGWGLNRAPIRAATIDPDVADSEPLLRSLAYASPEQTEKKADAEPADDLYGVGAILYDALTGQLPHHGRSVEAIRASVRGGVVAPTHKLRKEVVGTLSALVDRALHKDPKRRFSDAKAFARSLKSALAMSARVADLPARGGRRSLSPSTAVRQAIGATPNDAPPSAAAATKATPSAGESQGFLVPPPATPGRLGSTSKRRSATSQTLAGVGSPVLAPPLTTPIVKAAGDGRPPPSPDAFGDVSTEEISIDDAVQVTAPVRSQPPPPPPGAAATPERISLADLTEIEAEPEAAPPVVPKKSVPPPVPPGAAVAIPPPVIAPPARPASIAKTGATRSDKTASVAPPPPSTSLADVAKSAPPPAPTPAPTDLDTRRATPNTTDAKSTGEAAGSHAPAVDAPRVVGAPRTEASAVDTPAVEASAVEASAIEASAVDTPAIEASAIEASAVEAQVGLDDAPATSSLLERTTTPATEADEELAPVAVPMARMNPKLLAAVGGGVALVALIAIIAVASGGDDVAATTEAGSAPTEVDTGGDGVGDGDGDGEGEGAETVNATTAIPAEATVAAAEIASDTEAAATPTAPEEPTTVTISITGVPRGARVTLDGDEAVLVEDELVLPRGEASLTLGVTLDGFEPFERAFVTDRDQTIEVALAEVVPEPEPEPATPPVVAVRRTPRTATAMARVAARTTAMRTTAMRTTATRSSTMRATAMRTTAMRATMRSGMTRIITNPGF